MKRPKDIFLYFVTELKTCHLFILLTKHDTNDIADLSSMHIVCKLGNGLVYHRALEHRIQRSEVLFLIFRPRCNIDMHFLELYS